MRPSRIAPAGTAWLPERWPGGVVALAAVALSTLLCALLEPVLHPLNLLLVYTGGVVFSGLKAGRIPALMATAGAILAFNFAFVPPRWSLKPTDPEYYFTFLLMAAFGWLVAELSVRLRIEIERSEGRAWRAQTLARFASRLAQARNTEEVARITEGAVQEAVGATCEVQVLSPAGAAEAATPEQLFLPLQGAERELGHLVVQGLSPRPNQEILELLGAMANQTAVAMERALYEHKSIQALLESETERLRSTLLASISHDFRTPLTTIVGSTTSLLEQWDAFDTGQRQALLRAVLSESQRLHMLSSNLLDLTRMERGAVHPACEWCPADDLVNDVLSSVGARLALHRVHSRVPPDTAVWCDPRLIEQALGNLLENVARHTPAGTEVTVEVQTGKCEWTLTVSDNGPGFPGHHTQDDQPHHPRPLLERSRSDSSKGLGLSICAAIARLHDGHISLGTGPGARVTLSLPLPALPFDLIDEAR